MIYLITASLIWCFSFGLIGNTLAGLPRAWIAMLRLLISAAVFLPFIKRIPVKTGIRLCLIGTIQFGIMYLAYMHSFNYLKSHEVVLFTIFTPIYISIINDLQERQFSRRNLITAALAVGGSAVILWNKESRVSSISGFALLQISGICFAGGQLLYRRIFSQPESGLTEREDRDVLIWLYTGGALILLPIVIQECFKQMPHPTIRQIATILYLGIVASGIAFFLWNKGCRKVNTGTLAVMNNLKIPTGVLVSLLIFGESADMTALLAGSTLIGIAILAAITRNK